MNHEDRTHGSTQARHTEIVPAHMPEIDDAYHAHHHEMHAPSRKITFHLIARALKRHWWQAAILWAVGSVGLMVLAYSKVKPTFWAFSRVRIEPGERGIFAQNSNNSDYALFQETQVSVITSPPVIQAALSAHQELLQLPKLSTTDDPEEEIRRGLLVNIVPKTNLIQIEMTSESANEAVAIVNAVVEAYVRNASENIDQQTDKQLIRLREARQEKMKELDRRRTDLQQLQQKMRTVSTSDVKDRNSITGDEYRVLSSELLHLEIELMEAETRLYQLQNDQSSPVSDDPQSQDRELRELFESHPQAADILEQLQKAREQHANAIRLVRNPDDPSRSVPKKKMKKLEADLAELYAKLKPTLLAQSRRRGGDGGDRGLREAELRVSGLKAKQATLNEKLEKLNVRQRNEGIDQMQLEFVREDLKRAEGVFNIIEQQLSQTEFEAKNPIARIRLEFPARPSGRPNTNNRLRVMAIAPVGMMFGVLGLLVLIEMNAGRVVDPEDIPGRVHVPVLGVVPPLPQLRQSTGLFGSRDEFRTQRQLDQFLQSLDHLRVSLCSGRSAWGRDRRCILITSACGSEGKTTLAAQLSERCVNAGLSTLLIDGDLRNPTLSRMLDVPTHRGLINVLRGESLLEEAAIVVGGAGGFHFLPAGTPKVDPSRLLHGERLQKLIAQAREMFDIVIVDAPPVLPVPDALTIGRWTDGAVLAVRYDMSRFPLVEKANRRLATVGVPVIGAVVNGVRVMDSAYGSYYPSYAYSNDRVAQTPLDV
jgi:capsular exopolysaccharide synthesis family protein